MKKLIIFGIMLVMLMSFAIAVDTPSGGLAYYNLSSVVDYWNGNTATNYGATSNTTSYPSFNTSGDSSPSSYTFDGTNDYVDTAIDGFYRESFTYSAWFKKDTWNTIDIIIMTAKSNSINDQGIQTNINGFLSAKIGIQGGTPSDTLVSASAIEDTNWHFVVFTFDNSTGTLNLTLDNVLEDSQVGFNWNAGDDNGQINIGQYGDYAGHYFDGNIDHVKIFNKTLNVTEISNLYEYGNITAPSGPTYFKVTAIDNYDSASLSDFTINMTNGNGTVYTYYDAGATITTGFEDTDVDDWNITFWNNTGYENKDELNYALSSDLEFVVIPTTTPTITKNTFNVTSAYEDLTVWRTDYNDTVYTQDRTPTTTFSVDIRSNCSVSKTLNNYSSMISANVDSKCATTNVTSQSCTLPSNDELVDGPQWLYFACISEYGYETASYGFRGNISQDYEFIGQVLYNSTVLENATVYFTNMSTGAVLATKTSNATGWVSGYFLQYLSNDIAVRGFNPTNYSMGRDYEISLNMTG